MLRKIVSRMVKRLPVVFVAMLFLFGILLISLALFSETGNLTSSAVAASRIIYVDCSNTGPEDGTPEHPFNTIQKGVNNATDEDTVLVAPGIYMEKILIDKSIELRGVDRSTTIIDGRNEICPLEVFKDDVKIANFTIKRGNLAGIYVRDEVSRCNITHNILKENHYAIWIRGSANWIHGNMIIDNKRLHPTEPDPATGIRITGGTRNYIVNNFIKNNPRGVVLYTISNEIYHNIFIDNGQQAESSATQNIWINVEKSEGNYWSDHPCVDPDGNGVCNNPYVIDSDDQDEYPLVKPRPLPWETDVTPPEVVSVEFEPTCPPPFTKIEEYPFEKNSTRETEPVLVKIKVIDANLTGIASGVEKAFLSFRVNESKWFCTEMTYNSANDMYETIIPGQEEKSVCECKFTLIDKAGNIGTSDIIYKPEIINLVPINVRFCDLDGNGTVNILDIAFVAKYFGETILLTYSG